MRSGRRRIFWWSRDGRRDSGQTSNSTDSLHLPDGRETFMNFPIIAHTPFIAMLCTAPLFQSYFAVVRLSLYVSSSVSLFLSFLLPPLTPILHSSHILCPSISSVVSLFHFPFHLSIPPHSNFPLSPLSSSLIHFPPSTPLLPFPALRKTRS